MFLGPFGMDNKQNGEKAQFAALGWSCIQLATLGAYLVSLEFEQFKKKQYEQFEKVNLGKGMCLNLLIKPTRLDF